jgi:HAD superfamily hydrolase (TIGR01509 family)
MTGATLERGLVIFDCDGVLVDSEPISIRCTAAALNRFGYPIDEDGVFDNFLGGSTASMVKTVEESLGRTLAPEALDDLRREILAAFDVELTAIPGVAEAVDGLDRPFCVASSSIPERIRHSLRLTGLLPLFEPAIFSATMVVHGKPAPDLFLLAAKRLGAAPSECVVVEDSIHGAAAGQAAGMVVLGFTGGSHIAGDSDRRERHAWRLKRAGATLVFDSMADLPNLVRQVTR